MPASAAPAFAAAREMPRIAFAPSRPLFGDPSRSIIARSRPSWSATSRPRASSASSPFTFATACETPLPPHAEPPSRNSTASCTPVDAPEGTMARPNAPEPRRTSTSTVGLPRESRTWRPRTSVIVVMQAPLPGRSTRPGRQGRVSSTPPRLRARASLPPRRARGTAARPPGARAPDRRSACAPR